MLAHIFFGRQISFLPCHTSVTKTTVSDKVNIFLETRQKMLYTVNRRSVNIYYIHKNENFLLEEGGVIIGEAVSVL